MALANSASSARALAFLTERAEDAAAAVKGLLGGGSSSRYLEGADDDVGSIKRQLEADRDDARLEGLRRTVAMISKGKDASALLPSTLKLTGSASLEVKKLVYIIVLRYAPRQPDLALLSINSFQRDLTDSSPLIRGMALRVLSSIKVPMVANIVELAIAKAIRDPNFYVRKVAAMAIPKCYDLAPDMRDSLLKHVETLLADRSPFVLGVTLLTFQELAISKWDMVHPHYRKIVHALADIDEWAQPAVLQILGSYARRNLARPSTEGEKMDKDVQLLLSKAQPLLSSRNPAVVLAVARLYLYIAPPSYRTQIVGPLLRLVDSEPSVAFIALSTIYAISLQDADLFAGDLSPFVAASSVNEPPNVTALKLRLLVLLARKSAPESVELALGELNEHSRYHPSDEVAFAAIDGLAQLAHRVPSTGERSTTQLLQLLRTKGNRETVVARAVTRLRGMIQARSTDEQQGSITTGNMVSRLVPLLFGTPVPPTPAAAEDKKKAKVVGKGATTNAAARASIYWLLGQYCREGIKVRRPGTAAVEGTPDENTVVKTIAEVLAPDALRKAAANFAREDRLARLQIITFSTKLHAFAPTTSLPAKALQSISLLHDYIMQLARYDEDFEVRDRARLCKALTAGLAASAAKPNGESPASDDQGEGEAKSTDAAQSGTAAPADELLGGVRLRREQVLLILFEGKPASLVRLPEPSLPQGPAKSGEGGATVGSIAALVDRLIPGWERGAYPPWAPVEELPDASCREPAPLATFAAEDFRAASASASGSPSGSRPGSTTPSSAAAGAAAAQLANSTARSFSSESFQRAPSPLATGPGGAPPRVVLVPSNSSSRPSSAGAAARRGVNVGPDDAQTRAAAPALDAEALKRKALEDFLNESDEESEEELDDSAPEDEEYGEEEEDAEEDEDEAEEEESEDEQNGADGERSEDEGGFSAAGGSQDDLLGSRPKPSPVLVVPEEKNEWAA